MEKRNETLEEPALTNPKSFVSIENFKPYIYGLSSLRAKKVLTMFEKYPNSKLAKLQDASMIDYISQKMLEEMIKSSTLSEFVGQFPNSNPNWLVHAWCESCCDSFSVYSDSPRKL